MAWNFFKRNNDENQHKEELLPQSRNPNYKTFSSVTNDIERIVASRSVVQNQVKNQTPLANPVWETLGIDSSMLLMPVASNKAERLNQYRSMAKFTECEWCLDEIADEFIHEDESGNFIRLYVPENKENLNEIRRKTLQEQFVQYMNLFNIRDEGYNLIKRFLIEGELAWENVIDPKQPYLGIRGVKFLLPEYYETLVDTKTNRPVGIIFDTEKLALDIHDVLSNNYLGSALIFNRITPSTVTFSFNKDTCIPMLYSQLTYINSGDYSHDGLISYPLIEKSRQAYHQLALLQEAAVILRVTRAPERLLYNVSTGGMNQTYADEFVRNFANGLKAKKTAMPNGDVQSVYNPISMLENYVFSKATGSDGTTIESVGSSANYELMEDIEYFLRRFFKLFKVPFSRYKTPENAVPPLDQLSYEEHSFLRMIVRFLRRFALGFKKGFITHLKLRGIWDKYELVDSDINVEFMKPGMYELLEVQQIVQARMEIYKNSLGDDSEFSKILCMKKYLGMTDEEIKENYLNLIKEKELTQLADFYGGQVAEKKGIAGWESPLKFKADSDSEQTKLSLTGDEDAEKEDSEEGGDESGEGESSDEGGNESTEAPEAAKAPLQEEAKEAPEPSFGLS